ncbi:MAG: hypothetical protein ACD_44C00036G0008 [uncultured bacterium]|nr:MAG: hypothetical protein ACD_44C00036G0008 [uncultured bacterium]
MACTMTPSPSGHPRRLIEPMPPAPKQKKTAAVVTPIHSPNTFSATITPLNSNLLSLEDYANISTGNLWDRIPLEFQLEDQSYHPAVQAQIKWFSTHHDYLARTSERAAPYIYYIYEQLHQRQLPMELVLLPINESAYNPFATSGRGAGGLWQMIRGTASQYGVKQNWWFDGRRDIYASTKAALDHLTYLQNLFNGDWLLALAAYDCGEGTVLRAIRRNAAQDKSTDFWSLSLPEETRAYVPRLLALANIIRNRQAYNIDLPSIDDQPYLSQVDIEIPISLAKAAQLAKMNLAELKKLNAGHKYTEKTPLGSYKLALPIDRVDLFKNNLSSYHNHRHAMNEPEISQEDKLALQEKNPPQHQITYPRQGKQPIIRRVRKGDNLSVIAKLYKVSSNDIMQWNHLKSARLKPNTKLIVGFMDAPNTIKNVNPNSKKQNTKFAENNTAKKNKYYKVRTGDTLTKIAKQHNISTSSLEAHNHLQHKTLKAGQRLTIPYG